MADFALMGKLGLDSRDFVSGAKSAEKSIDGVSSKMDDLPPQAGKQGSAAGGLLSSNLAKGFALAGGTTALAAGFKSTIDAASDLAESTNAVGVAFGTAGGDVLKFGEDSAEAYGMSKTAFNEAAVGFSSFAIEIAGKQGDVAGTLDDLMTRATDMASVFNVSVPEAAEAMRSALSGEAEPMKRFGIILTEAKVNAYALSSGIIEAGGSMTDAQKQAARYGLIMQETAKVQGDWAKTSDGFAGSTKKLSAEWTNFQASIGTALLPAMGEYVGLASDLLGTAQAMADLDVSGINVGLEGMASGLVKVSANLLTFGLADKFLPDSQKVKAEIHDLTVGFGLWGDTSAEVAAQVELASRINANEYSDSITKVNDSIVDATADLALHESGLRTANDSYNQVTGAINEAKAALDAQTEAANRTRDANRLTADATYDLYAAEDQLAAAIETANTVLADNDSSLRDIRQANVDVATAMDATVTKQLELNGVNVDTVVGQKAWTEAMLVSAGTLSGPMQTEVLAHIGRVNGIPAEKITAILTDADPNDLAQVTREIDELTKPRTVPIYFDARDSVTFTVYGHTPGRAGGGPVEAGRPYIVGEEGRELFVPKVAGDIVPHPQTVAMMSKSVAAPAYTPTVSNGSTAFANGTGVIINHYGPNLSAADVSRGYTLARLAQV